MSRESSSYAYYPGCSLHSTGLEYGLSTQAVFEHLELEFRAVDGNLQREIFQQPEHVAVPAVVEVESFYAFLCKKRKK